MPRKIILYICIALYSLLPCYLIWSSKPSCKTNHSDVTDTSDVDEIILLRSHNQQKVQHFSMDVSWQGWANGPAAYTELGASYTLTWRFPSSLYKERTERSLNLASPYNLLSVNDKWLIISFRKDLGKYIKKLLIFRYWNVKVFFAN